MFKNMGKGERWIVIIFILLMLGGGPLLASGVDGFGDLAGQGLKTVREIVSSLSSEE